MNIFFCLSTGLDSISFLKSPLSFSLKGDIIRFLLLVDSAVLGWMRLEAEHHILSTGLIPRMSNPLAMTIAVASQRSILHMLILITSPKGQKKVYDVLEQCSLSFPMLSLTTLLFLFYFHRRRVYLYNYFYIPVKQQ